jgi:Flp pilus assembly protein TadG
LLLLNHLQSETAKIGCYAMLQFIKKRLATRRMLTVRAARRLARKQDGSAAVEFGLVAGPFLLVVFAIMETALVFFAGQTLETAVADSSRLIMTGQAQQQGFDQAAFKSSVCSRIYGLFDCNNGLFIDVKTYPNFASINLDLPIDADGNFQTNMNYQAGVAGDIVVVRMFYQWPVYVSMLTNMSGNKRLLAATLAFRNEPYTTNAPSL